MSVSRQPGGSSPARTRSNSARAAGASDARRAALSYFNLGKIIFHRSDQSGPVKPPSAEQIAQVTGVPVMQVYADSEFVAYQLEPTAAPAVLPAIIALDNGWKHLDPTRTAGSNRTAA